MRACSARVRKNMHCAQRDRNGIGKQEVGLACGALFQDPTYYTPVWSRRSPRGLQPLESTPRGLHPCVLGIGLDLEFDAFASTRRSAIPTSVANTRTQRLDSQDSRRGCSPEKWGNPGPVINWKSRGAAGCRIRLALFYTKRSERAVLQGLQQSHHVGCSFSSRTTAATREVLDERSELYDPSKEVKQFWACQEDIGRTWKPAQQ